MRSILLAATFLLFDSARSSVAHRLRPVPRPVPRPVRPVDPAAAGPIRLVTPSVDAWARAAELEATAALLTTRPGVVRRVAAH